ncbi:HTH-type transcriptional regulator Cbl, partial [Escherichia coli]|nr:HTH-type transcriptional regulator Cbl [Escherichia coli]
MNFQQLKIIREAARQDYNLTEVANMLFTSHVTNGAIVIHTQRLKSDPG